MLGKEISTVYWDIFNVGIIWLFLLKSVRFYFCV